VIKGTVSASGVPTIELAIAGKSYRCIVDSGFNGDVELPEELRKPLNAKLLGSLTFNLAAGTIVEEDVYQVEIPFDGRVVKANATFADTDDVLIGTRLLRDYRLTIDFLARTVELERVREQQV
jgi:clan AA aspartic protease